MEVRFRLIRATDVPATNPEGDAYDFGLQDTKGTLQAPQRLADGRLAFDFALTAKPGKEADRPNFTGVFASGPADDRFVYLAWRSVPRGVWVNRLKARLRDIDWPLARQASETGAVLVADLTGLPPGGGNRPVDWRLVDG